MGQSQAKQHEQQPAARKRKAMVSPELSEFMHMLKSLETELSPQQAQTR